MLDLLRNYLLTGWGIGGEWGVGGGGVNGEKGKLPFDCNTL